MMDSAQPVIDGESLVEQVRNELVEIDSMNINDHAQRFEELHHRLTQTLSSIDGL